MQNTPSTHDMNIITNILWKAQELRPKFRRAFLPNPPAQNTNRQSRSIFKKYKAEVLRILSQRYCFAKRVRIFRLIHWYCVRS